MFERFTDRARRIITLSQEQARSFNHNYIGTEHILLGILDEKESIAAQALVSSRIELDEARQLLLDIIGLGGTPATGHIPFTPRVKKILDLSLREALQLGHNYIGPEHLLLGLIREGEGVAAQILVKLGADLNDLRKQVIHILMDERADECDVTVTVVPTLEGIAAALRDTRHKVAAGALIERQKSAEAEATALDVTRLQGVERVLRELLTEVALTPDSKWLAEPELLMRPGVRIVWETELTPEPETPAE